MHIFKIDIPKELISIKGNIYKLNLRAFLLLSSIIKRSKHPTKKKMSKYREIIQCCMEYRR